LWTIAVALDWRRSRGNLLWCYPVDGDRVILIRRPYPTEKTAL